MNENSGAYDWSHNSVYTILARESYTGVWSYGKTRQATTKGSVIADELITEPVTMKIPAIVSQELFKAAQEKITANKNKTYNKKSKFKFLLRGRVFCGKCGLSCQCIGHAQSKGYRVYKCATRNRSNDPANFRECDLPNFKRDVVEFNVWQWLTDLMDDDKELKKGYQEYLELTAREVQPLQAELERIAENLKELQDRLTQQTTAVKMLADIGSTIATDSIKTELLQTEELITRNKSRQKEIESQLEEKSTDVNIITDFDKFIIATRIGIRKAQNRFDKKREIIKAMNVTVELIVKNGEMRYIARCILKPNNTKSEPCLSVPKHFGF